MNEERECLQELSFPYSEKICGEEEKNEKLWEVEKRKFVRGKKEGKKRTEQKRLMKEKIIGQKRKRGIGKQSWGKEKWGGKQKGGSIGKRNRKWGKKNSRPILN